MEKAYDLKALREIMKGKGLDLAEDAASIAKDAILQWLKESAQLSSNPWDDMLVAAIPMFDSEINKSIDKIDGKQG